MKLRIAENLKTRSLNINGKKGIYTSKNILDLKKSPFIYFTKLNLGKFEDFKNYFELTGDLYLKGLLGFIKYAILPFPEDEHKDINDTYGLEGYLNAYYESYSISEDDEREYEYLLNKIDLFKYYAKENRLDNFKDIESLIMEELKNTHKNNTKFDLYKLTKLHNFIFNNNFQNPHVRIPNKIIKFSEAFDNLKIILSNLIYLLKSLHNNKPNSEINFKPALIDYFHNDTGDKDYDIEIYDLENILERYLAKIKIDVNLQELNKPFYYNYTDLNLDTLLFLEVIQKLIYDMKIGECSNCNDFFILSKKQYKWKNTFCSDECRIKYKNNISNRNKKERLIKDKNYRKNTNKYMRDYMRDYRKMGKK